MIKTVQTTLILLMLIALGYFGNKAYQHAKLYESYTTSIATACDANGLAQGKLDKLTSVISFGLIEDKTKAKLNRLQTEQKSNKTVSQTHLYYFIATLMMLMLFSFTCSPKFRTLIFAIGSLLSLIFGLINPILMVTIHKEVEYLGDVVLSFESKGILGSIGKLFDNGELVVAVTILLFSVIVPLVKILTIIFTLLFKEYNFGHKLINFFKHLGKWSMIDVFVVASLMVYLTSNSGGLSHAEIEIGLYFFLIYVILSMLTTMMIISPSSHHRGH